MNSLLNQDYTKKQLAYQYYQLKNQHGGSSISISEINHLNHLAGKINYSRLQGKLNRMKIRLNKQTGGESNFRNLVEVKKHYNELLKCCQEYSELLPKLGEISIFLKTVIQSLKDWLASLEKGDIPERTDGQAELLRNQIRELEETVRQMREQKEKCSVLDGIKEILDKGEVKLGETIRTNQELRTNLSTHNSLIPGLSPEILSHHTESASASVDPDGVDTRCAILFQTQHGSGFPDFLSNEGTFHARLQALAPIETIRSQNDQMQSI